MNLVSKLAPLQHGVGGGGGAAGEEDDAPSTVVQEWVELNNGCVCCTVKGTLIQTIEVRGAEVQA